MDEDKIIESYFLDAITEKAYPIEVGEDLVYLYPVTLGKMIILQRLVESLEINEANLKADPNLEMLRIVHEKKDNCCQILAYHTAFNDYRSVMDYKEWDSRRNAFMKENNEDIASVMLMVLSSERTDIFLKHYKILSEQDRMRKVMSVKSSNNNIDFGGLTMYGTLIDAAMERYGLTKRQVVWELDYTSLRMLLADKINSVYVTDEERKKVPASILAKRGDVIMPTKENMKTILSMDWR